MKPNFKKRFTTILISLALVLSFSFGSFFMLRAKGLDEDAVPRAPQSLAIVLNQGEYKLTWKDGQEWDIFSYVVYLRTSEEKKASKSFLTGRREDYVIKDLKPETQYFVSLAARDIGGNISKVTPEIGFYTGALEAGGYTINAWMPATADLEDAVVSYEQNMDLFSTISPFIYSMEEDGNLVKKATVLSEELSEKTKKEGVLVIPSITNNFDKDKKSTNLLLNEEATGRHIDVIVKEVLVRGYDGIDIDYENLDGSTRDRFSAFVEKLAKKLHEHEKILSVTVQPKKSDSDVWVKAYDYQKLGELADQVRIMTYDYARPNTVPGPVAPISWFREVLYYAKSKIPEKKVIAGIPTYGYSWCQNGDDDQEAENCQNKGLVYQGVKNIISKYKPLIEWNSSAASPWFLYLDESGNKKVVYFEDHQSIAAKLEVVKELKLQGVSLWRLGNEDPEIYSKLEEKLTVKTSVPDDLSIWPLDGKIKLSWKEPASSKIRGYRVFHARKDQTEPHFVDVIGQNEYIIPNLENGTSYFIQMMPLETGDESYTGYYGSILESEKKSSPIVITPADLAYPGDITDLKVERIGTSTIDFSFTAPGDEYFEGKVHEYDVRYSEKQITEDNFKKAKRYPTLPVPGEAKEKINWEMRGLEGGIHYYISIMALDEAGNPSNISNVVSAKTIDIIPPKIPEISAILPKDKSLEVIWKANAEKDLAGYAVYFKQEKEAYNVLKIAKDVNHVTIPELENNYSYSVSIKAFDVNGNESGQSKDETVVPKSTSTIKRISEETHFEKEKLKGALHIFGQKIVTKNSVPYVVMLSVIIVNLFIINSFREEIKQMLRFRESYGDSDENKRKVRISDFKRG